MVRVMIKWKYPFQPPTEAGSHVKWDGTKDEGEKERRGRREPEATHKPIAKPRMKVIRAVLSHTLIGTPLI